MTGEPYDAAPGASGPGGPLPGMVHPTWCDRSLCTMSKDGAHRSTPARVDASPLLVEVYLEQRAPIPGFPRSGVVLVFISALDTADADAEELGFPLDGEQAVILGRLLRDAGREAQR